MINCLWSQQVERIGSSPHSDWGFLTLIMQDNVGGLQVQPSGTQQWIDVPVVDGALVLNIGDYLSLLTHGRFISPLHRVIADQRER
jgi:isopenicillin N synthase-like dioxygenase